MTPNEAFDLEYGDGLSGMGGAMEQAFRDVFTAGWNARAKFDLQGDLSNCLAKAIVKTLAGTGEINRDRETVGVRVVPESDGIIEIAKLLGLYDELCAGMVFDPDSETGVSQRLASEN